MQDHPIEAPIILIVAYTCATVLLVPGSILTVGAGFAFYHAYGGSVVQGVVVGTVSVWVGAQLGSTAAFLLGRYFLREVVAEKA